MTNSPNPEHLLRRPKKPVHTAPNYGAIAGGAGAVIVVAGAIVAFVMFGHPKSAANPPAQAASTLGASGLAAYAMPTTLAPSTKHKPAKRPGAGPIPGASPSAAPTSTPAATPTPVVTAGLTPDQIARAKHNAALRLAALRRQQAAQAAAAGLGTTASTPTDLTAQATALPTQTVATPVPASPTAQPAPIFAPREIVDARFVDRVAPVYPDIAREQGAAGTAIVLATVGPDGGVQSVSLDQSTGNKLLDSAALTAARASTFEPPEIDGRPATETYRIVYTFDPSQ